jgi:hypothetical protein
MNYSYEINPNNKIISVLVIGDIITKEFYILDKEIRNNANGLKYKVIFDLRYSKKILVSESHSNIYQNFNDLMTIPVAFIVNEINDTVTDFFERTDVNNYFTLKTFKDDSSAYEWLTKY